MNRAGSSNINNGRKSLAKSRFGFDKFMQLARNSFNVGKFARTCDNCRLAVEYATQQSNAEGAMQAYQLWLDALFNSNKYTSVKKVCCEARSRFGNNIDLLYYEFKAALLAGDKRAATRLGKEFIEMSGSPVKNISWAQDKVAARLEEVNKALSDLQTGNHKALKQTRSEK